ncbi:MAG TPA: hypothetical protein DIV39_09375 [Verrucomicrobiales bacterium]|nr:hypothetical protein [Verrucomicrobiales bacterium]
MKTVPNRKAYLLSLLAAGALSPYAVSQDLPGIETQLQGEWIAYRGDQFDIKKITREKATQTFYDWNGNLLYQRTSDLKVKVVGSGERKTIIEKGAEWHYLAGGKKPEDTLWTTLSFDAAKGGWKKGPSGFGYADDDDATVLDDMQDKYLSVFIRREFEIPKGADMKGLSLRINYDDGFVLHANGRRLFSSSNVSVNEESGEVSVGNHEAGGLESFSLADFGGVFKEGRNVIAIEGINATLDSSDFTLDPQLLIGKATKFVETNRKEKHETAKTDWFFNNRAWDGKVDNLQIWSRALSDSEVGTLWNKGKGTAKATGKLTDGLVGHWPFDGDFKDASGNGRHGTARNSPPFVKGQLGQALDLNGENQYVLLGGKSADYTPEGGSITVSVWFSPDGFDKRWQTLIALGDGGWGDWRIHREALTKNMQFVGVRKVGNTAPVLDGKMHHLVAIAEKGKGVRLFIDNEVVSNNPPAEEAEDFAGIPLDKDEQVPALGANLQGPIFRSMPLEGEFIPMEGSLRVAATSGIQGWGSGNANSYSGLYRQVEHPEEALLIAARAGNLKKVESLLNAGVDPNATSQNSYTALSYAAAGGHLEMIKLLLKNGADVNKQARHMKNSLSVVAGSSHVEAAKLLLANGAKMMVNANGSSVVHEAVIWRQPEMLKFILGELKVGVDLKSANGRTPLHNAIARMEKGQNIRNQLDIASVKILLQYGADSNQQFTHNNVKRSATGLAEFKGLDKVVALLKSR